MTLEHLPLLEGYWRDPTVQGGTTDVRRCGGGFAGSACVGCSGEDARPQASPAAARTGGPYCALCDLEAWGEDDAATVLRPRKARVPGLRVGGESAGVLRRTGGGAPRLLHRVPAEATRKVAATHAGWKRNNGHKWWHRHARAQRRLKVKSDPLRLLSGHAQGETYLITFPSSVEQYLDVFAFTNLELDGLGLPQRVLSSAASGTSCCS